MKEFYQKISSTQLWRDESVREPLYTETASLTQNIYVFTGQMDVQTRPEEALRLQSECQARNKLNCEVTIVPGLGHGMSLPKGPRRQKLLDATLGPVEDSFLSLLTATALRL